MVADVDQDRPGRGRVEEQKTVESSSCFIRCCFGRHPGLSKAEGRWPRGCLGQHWWLVLLSVDRRAELERVEMGCSMLDEWQGRGTSVCRWVLRWRGVQTWR